MDTDRSTDEFEFLHWDLIERARKHLERKEFDEALGCAKRAYDLGVHPDRAATALAGISNGKKDFESAERWAREALDLGGDTYYPLRYLWHALWWTDQHDEADAIAERLRRVSSPSVDVETIFALNACHRCRFSLAASFARAGAKIDPDHLGPARFWPLAALLSLNPVDFARSLTNFARYASRRLRSTLRRCGDPSSNVLAECGEDAVPVLPQVFLPERG